MIILAIRFFEPLFGALIVMPFFGLPRCLHRFKLSSSLTLNGWSGKGYSSDSAMSVTFSRPAS